MRFLKRFFRPTQNWERVTGILVLGSLYIAIFKPVFDFSGPVVAALVTIPVVACGWFFGPMAGLVAGVAGFALNAGLFFMVDGVPGLMLFAGGWCSLTCSRATVWSSACA